jgi:Uncharacterised conserved protein (DUF2368)
MVSTHFFLRTIETKQEIERYRTRQEMGHSNSKVVEGGSPPPENKRGQKSLVAQIKSNVEDELARRVMIQREVQMAVSLAQTRDTLWIYGSAWGTLSVGVATARALGRPVPPLLGVPIVVGALVLGNMADLAYGNKLARVVKEAEYIMEYERARFVPFKQAAFFKFYTDEEREEYYGPATAVGDLWPNRMIARDLSPKK